MSGSVPAVGSSASSAARTPQSPIAWTIVAIPTAWALVASPFGSKSLAHAEAGLIIGLSLFLSMFVAAAIGTLLPVILKKVGLDPARAAGPFVTTTVDVLGTVIYLSMASMMLRR